MLRTSGIFVIVSLMLASQAKAELFVLADDLTLNLEAEFSYGLRYRLDDIEWDLVGVQNPSGRGKNVDLAIGDNGTLNYPRHAFTDNQVGVALDTIVRWRHNLELYVSGYAFYDFENSDGDRAYVELGDTAEEQFGHDADIRNAYLRYAFELSERPVEIRLGEQNLRWSQSIFYAGTGLGQLDPIDLPSLYRPVSRPKDVLKPFGLLLVQADVGANFSVEAFYQYDRAETELLAMGTYWSTDDALSPGAELLPAGPFAPDRPGVCGGNRASGYPAVYEGCYGSKDPLWWATNTDTPRREIVESHFLSDGTAIGIPLDADGNALAFDPDTGQLLETDKRVAGYRKTGETQSFYPRRQDSGGQYGLRVRGIIPQWSDTLWALSYARISSRLPRIEFITGQQVLLDSTLIGAANPGYDPQLEFFDRVNLLAHDEFMQFFYPEDIDIFGFSLNTTIPATGTAVNAELTFTQDNPLPVAAFEISHFIVPNDFALENGLQQGRHELLVERDTLHATLGLTHVLGAVLGSQRMTVGLEAAYMHIYDMPALDGREGNDPEHVGVMLAPMGQGFGEGFLGTAPTDSAWGYTVFGSATYDGVIENVSITPTLAFRHDVDGYSPAQGAGPFLESRKVLNAGVRFNVLSKYIAELSYRRFSGGGYSGKYNQLIDRDYLQLVFRYAY